MTRLYATIKSERPSRPARKGADRKLEIELTHKGIPEYSICYSTKGLKVKDHESVLLERKRKA